MSNKETKSLAYNVGVYLAEYIMRADMPCLYHDAWTKNVISTTWGEHKQLQRLEEAWFTKYNSQETKNAKDTEKHKVSEMEWNEFLKYRYVLKEKYLPHTLTSLVPFIDFSNEETNKEIKEGFISAMWDSDHCEYSLKEEDIVFENEVSRYGEDEEYSMTNTWVTLKLDLAPPTSYTGDSWIEIKTLQKDK